MNVVPELKFAEYSKLQYTQICFSLQCPMHHQKHTTVKIGLTKKKKYFLILVLLMNKMLNTGSWQF